MLSAHPEPSTAVLVDGGDLRGTVETGNRGQPIWIQLGLEQARTPSARPDAALAVDDHQYHLRAVGTSAHKEMERRELAAQVQAGIDKLPPDLKTCVILRDVEELSYQEIVEVLQIPEGTVKSRINRGRIELAKILRRMRVVTI